MYDNHCIFNPSFLCPMMRRPCSNMNMGLNYNYNFDDIYEDPFNPIEEKAFNIKFKRVSLEELID